MSMENSIGVSHTKGQRRILVVGEKGFFSEIMTEYAIEVAKRLNYQILGLNIAGPEKSRELKERVALPDAVFRKHDPNFSEGFKNKSESEGVDFEYLEMVGPVGTSVEKILYEKKRIAFVITGSDEVKEIVAENIAIPVFSVLSNNQKIKGGTIMVEGLTNKRPLKKTLAYGALSAALYAAVFTNAGTVTGFFTKGGWYAALPIATVFIFSFAHGAFASNLWSLLGIEAATRQMEFKTVEKSVQPDVFQNKTARKRPRARAYVNPFHRM
jgi:hypothetical protein